MTTKTLVQIASVVNAASVSLIDGGKFILIKDVCGAVDDIVMNQALYPAAELASGAGTLEGKPAPAGHPKNEKGQYISALNGAALLSAFIGSICTNVRHEGGRTLADIKINVEQAKAHPDGAKLVERCMAAINGENVAPIHVSTGVLCKMIQANGESMGRSYSRIATDLKYDHLAILFNERGAGTPDQGVGMFLNRADEVVDIERVEVNTEPQDSRSAGLKAWVLRLLGNASADLSFDRISEELSKALPERAWLREVFDRYAIWQDQDGRMFRQDYSVSSNGLSVAFIGQPVEVARKVEYAPITNSNEVDPVKDKILAALNAAGISTEGLDETQLLTAYNFLVVKPVNDKLTAANSAIAGFEATALAAQNAERDALAVKLATNSSLTADDFKAMPLARLKELDAKAAPVVVGNTSAKPGDEFASYSMNSHLEAK